MRILLAYDGSRHSDAAVDETLRRPWPAGSQVHLVMVLEWPMLMVPSDGIEVTGPISDQVLASQRQDAYHRLQTVVDRFRSRPDLQATYELREGSVKHALLDAIQDWKADLVIAGSHGRKPLARLFVGSVCHALVTHAPCNVEVVKTPPA